MIRALAAAALLTGVLGAAAPAVAVPADPPEVAYRSGTVVHLPNGSTVTLPVRDVVEVLGRRSGQWLLHAFRDGSDQVLALRDGRVRTIWSNPNMEESVGFALRQGAPQVIESVTDRGSRTELTVFDLDGEVLGTRVSFDGLSVIGQDAEALYLGFWEGPTRRWVPGEKPVGVGPNAYLAAPAADLLFVKAGDDEDGDDLYGPTSLSDPGTPPWSAVFDPGVVSPDGLWVAGSTYDRRSVLQVRRVSDGAVLPLPRLRPDWESESWLGWERDGDLLAVVGKGGRHWVVRCTVSTAACERVVAPTTGPLGLVP